MIGRIHSLESFGTVDGPGIRFVVFMQGCPMRCLYCHNPDTWDFNATVQYKMTPQELLAEVCKYKSFIASGGVTLTGGEPFMQADFANEFLTLCKEKGIHTAVDTSGVVFGKKVKEALEHTDLILLDVKTADNTLHHTLTGHSRDNNKAFLDYLQSIRKPVWIRHVVVPTLTDDDSRLRQLAEYIARYDVVERVELLPYHTMGIYKYEKIGIDYPLKDTPSLPAERLAKALEIFRAHLECPVIG